MAIQSKVLEHNPSLAPWSTGRRFRVRAWDAITELKGSRNSLIAAARGNLKAVERLLEAGADINAQSESGRTALHAAALWGRTEIAARLLALGANPNIEDRKGRKALGLDNISPDTLHVVRQKYHRLRIRESIDGLPPSERVRRWAADLDRQRIIKISGLITPAELTCLQADFEKFVQNLDDKLARGEGLLKNYDDEEHWWPKDFAYVSNNAFKYSTQLIRLCCSHDLRAFATLYVGNTAYIQRGTAMRYLPTESTANGMFDWHHDLEDKRFKIMILLTDVDEGGQHMSYVLGSHRLLHPYEMFFKNKCSLEYCRDHLPEVAIFDAIGKAGDMFIFDSNGAHRGVRRKTAAVRDVFLVEFSSDQNQIWGGDFSPHVFDGIAMSGPNPFARMLSVEKKWNRGIKRQAPTWIESLSQVDKWL